MGFHFVYECEHLGTKYYHDAYNSAPKYIKYFMNLFDSKLIGIELNVALLFLILILFD